MSKRNKEKARKNSPKMDSGWMVMGMFIGWLIGVVLGWICDQPFLWMAGGAISGCLLGALADYILWRHK